MSLRWQKLPKVKHKVGDRRVVRRFLFLPTSIGGNVRWLGVEAILQEAYIGWTFVPEGPRYKTLKWRNVGWWTA